MAKFYREGKAWAKREHYKNNDLYASGATQAAITKELTARKTAIDKNALPLGLGAKATTVAQSLQDYAIKRLPFLKGAVQEARRINHYLRHAGLDTLVVRECPKNVSSPNAHTIAGEALGSAAGGKGAKEKSGKGAYFKVTLEAHTLERKIANGLHQHRRNLMTQNARTDKHRAVLATMPMSEVTRGNVQDLIDAMKLDKNAPATVALERSMLRVLFFHAFSKWRWHELYDNPATQLTMPEVDNDRDRVMSQSEQELLDLAFADCKNKLVGPVVALLRETAMRSSEPLQIACWKDVDWEARLLKLSDSKTSKRDVPLSPLALQALRDIGPGEPNERIVKITYESLRASWTRACQRAGIEHINLHDLRHTAATRMAIKTGNLFLVKALTGHKTTSMVMRYANVKASDVVDVMHAQVDVPATTAQAVAASLPAQTQQTNVIALEQLPSENTASLHVGGCQGSCRVKGVG